MKKDSDIQSGATPPVYVISMLRSSERRAFMAYQLEKLGLPHTFMDAVDGSQLSTELRAEIEAQRDRCRYEKPFTAGEIGCMYSHMNAYKKILANKDKCALILEDDVFLTETLSDFLLQEVINGLPYDWDIVLLAYVQRGNVESRTTKSGVMAYGARKKLAHNFTVGVPVQFCFHTAGYLVSAKGAQGLCTHGMPLRMPADILTGNAQTFGMNLYIVSKPIVRQHHEWALHSTIKEDTQESTYAYALRHQAEKRFGMRFLWNIKRIAYFFRRLCSYAWNKIILAIRGHTFPVVFLRKLGLLPPDSI